MRFDCAQHNHRTRAAVKEAPTSVGRSSKAHVRPSISCDGEEPNADASRPQYPHPAGRLRVWKRTTAARGAERTARWTLTHLRGKRERRQRSPLVGELQEAKATAAVAGPSQASTGSDNVTKLGETPELADLFKVLGSSKVSWWRWRELNPRPSVQREGFSGRSLLMSFSAPAVTQASYRRAQSLCMSRAHPVTECGGAAS